MLMINCARYSPRYCARAQRRCDRRVLGTTSGPVIRLAMYIRHDLVQQSKLEFTSTAGKDTMATSNIVLPPLDTWAKEHLTALITAKTGQDFDQAFDDFIAKNVKVTFNGAPLTRDQYKQQLQGERLLEADATINIENVVIAPQLNTQATQVKFRNVVCETSSSILTLMHKTELRIGWNLLHRAIHRVYPHFGWRS